MEEIINSILQAEEKAEKILAEASDKSKRIAKDSVKKSEEIKEKAILSFKEAKKTAILEAEKKAEKEYNKKIKEGILDADSLISAVKGKVEKIVKEEVEKIIR